MNGSTFPPQALRLYIPEHRWRCASSDFYREKISMHKLGVGVILACEHTSSTSFAITWPASKAARPRVRSQPFIATATPSQERPQDLQSVADRDTKACSHRRCKDVEIVVSCVSSSIQSWSSLRGLRLGKPRVDRHYLSRRPAALELPEATFSSSCTVQIYSAVYSITTCQPKILLVLARNARMNKLH